MLYILFMCNCSTMCAVTGMVLAVDAVLKECDIQLLVVLYSSVCVRACVRACVYFSLHSGVSLHLVCTAQQYQRRLIPSDWRR